MKRYFPTTPKIPKSSSTSQDLSNLEERTSELEQDQQSERVNLSSLEVDPEERLVIRKYHPNDHDAIRRKYIQRGPFQPREHKFPQRNFYGKLRRFNPQWFDEYDWLEYSITKDATFCLYCYLFQDDCINQGEGDVFSTVRFTISRKCDDVQEPLLVVSNILNMVGSSFKSRYELRESQADEIEEALRKGELETGRGLNQELGLARAEKCKAKGCLKACLIFEIAFMLHFMHTVLAVTNKLSVAFQKKEQDIANVVIHVRVTKDRLQQLREDGWAPLIDEVSMFCIKYDILIPNFDEPYMIFGRSRRRVAEYSILHHYRVVVFCKTIDWQFQELNSRFDELENYIVDVWDHDKRFSDLKGLGDLSKKLVETKKHGTYPLVFRLVKFDLILPVVIATVERAFSTMKLIKTDLRNRMDDEILSGCLVPYIEKDVFCNVSNEAIMNTFQNMKTHRGEL
ncbi:uncharacterized protein [Nicotiana sylvestris]|uniref:uncharacterized protein n=1 Tax=Nicotiana sylvestris TaxID=4096 RepID=UPI00388C5553